MMPGPFLIVHEPDGQRVVGAAGAPTLVKAGGPETGGLFELFVQSARPGAGPPLHIHHECSESFYVIDGEFTFRLGEEYLPARTGSIVFIPRGMPHTYTNVLLTEGRLLFWFTPAARMAAYFKAIEELGDSMTSELLDGIASRHGVQIVR